MFHTFIMRNEKKSLFYLNLEVQPKTADDENEIKKFLCTVKRVKIVINFSNEKFIKITTALNRDKFYSIIFLISCKVHRFFIDGSHEIRIKIVKYHGSFQYSYSCQLLIFEPLNFLNEQQREKREKNSAKIFHKTLLVSIDDANFNKEEIAIIFMENVLPSIHIVNRIPFSIIQVCFPSFVILKYDQRVKSQNSCDQRKINRYSSVRQEQMLLSYGLQLTKQTSVSEYLDKIHKHLNYRPRRVADADCTGSSTASFAAHNNAFTNYNSCPDVILQTLVIRLNNGNHQTLARALIDTGSQNSYATKEVLRRMDYNCLGETTIVLKLFGGLETKAEIHRNYRINLSSINGRYKCNFEVLDQIKICSEIPRIPVGPWTAELKKQKISLSDTVGEPCNSRDDIQLLIGADVAGKLLTGRIHSTKTGPTAVETKLGWTLIGKINCR